VTSKRTGAKVGSIGKTEQDVARGGEGLRGKKTQKLPWIRPAERRKAWQNPRKAGVGVRGGRKGSSGAREKTIVRRTEAVGDLSMQIDTEAFDQGKRSGALIKNTRLWARKGKVRHSSKKRRKRRVLFPHLTLTVGMGRSEPIRKGGQMWEGRDGDTRRPVGVGSFAGSQCLR